MSLPMLVTGATGLTGTLLLQQLAALQPGTAVTCLVRPSSDRRPLEPLPLTLNYLVGDSAEQHTWDKLLTPPLPQVILHLASIRHLPLILARLGQVAATPRLIVVGTTSVHSRYHPEAACFQQIESQLAAYPGSACLLRPTLIYGSPRDRNFSKLIRFCDRYRWFPVFGSRSTLIQPIHAADLAQALVQALQRPWVTGAYDLSGGSIVNLRQLLKLVAQAIAKPILPLPLPLAAGLGLATLLQTLLGARSPLKPDQILRLQEDKVYPHWAAQQDLDFQPRSLALGLQQQVVAMRAAGVI